MFKRVSIFLLVVGLSFIYTQLSSADIVLLKTGMTLEGKIIEKTDDYVKIKTRSGIGTFKLDKVRGVVTDEEVPSATFPADIYRQRLNKIGENDAQAHYELGIFCLQNGLPDEAREEFNKAKEIDSEYEGRVKKQLVEVDKLKAEILYNCGIFFCKYGQPKRGIAYLEELIKTYPENDLVEKAEDLLAGVREENPLPQPLTLEEIKLKFKQGKLPIPIAKEDQENIVEFINKMPEDKKLYYCKRYLDIGEEYAAKIPLKESLDEKNKAHTTALYCYRIASKIALKEKDLKSQALNKMRSLSDKLSRSVTHESIIKDKLPIPIPGKEDEVLNTIRGLGAYTAERIGARYSTLGNVYMKKAHKASSALKKKEYLKIAANCYKIAVSFYRDELSRALIEAKRKEAQSQLSRLEH